MITEDFHVHSSFSDGADPPEAVAEAAAAQGMTRLGFSDHGWAPYDTDCCIPRDRQAAYRACIRDLAERWRGRLELYCGVEQDFYAGPDAPTGEYDYVIGSVHYLRLGGAYFSVDWKPEFLLDAAERFFGGDRLAVAEEYFRTVAQVPEVTGCHIIGHFDLIAKLNRRYRLFDSSHPRYIAAWKAAAERLLASGLPFEINTGGMARGYCMEPYPAPEIQRYLAERGASFILSSDSHDKRLLRFDFEAQERAARDRGCNLISFRPPKRNFS